MYDPDIGAIERKIEDNADDIAALEWAIRFADDIVQAYGSDTIEDHSVRLTLMLDKANRDKTILESALIRHKKSRENARVSY